MVTGRPTKALCGTSIVPESQGAEAIPDGLGAGNKTFAMCPECELFFRALPGNRAKTDRDQRQGAPVGSEVPNGRRADG
jgi:hypothetical protein